MANTYKNIVITPNIGNTSDPRVQFSGGNTTANTDINLYVYPTSNGTLSFEGSAGQLFSVTNDLSNLIFSVADVSGIPSLEVYANSLISVAPFGGNVVLGNTAELVFPSTAGIFANGTQGTTGQFLTTNGTAVYWSTGANLASPTIIGATTANGSSFTYANVSGQVNTATLFATTSANVGANVQLTTSTLTIGNSIVNTSYNSVGISFLGNSTVNSSLLSSALQVANSTGNVQTTAVSLTVQNSTVNSVLGLQSLIIQSNSTVNSSISNTLVQVANSTGNVQHTATTLLAQTNTTVNASMTASLVRIANSTGSANLTATSLVIGNTTIQTTNTILGGTLAANGGIGSAGQALISAAAGNVYWATIGNGTVTSVASGNGIISSTGGAITGTGTLYADGANGISVDASGINVLANSGIIANTTGVFADGANGISVTTGGINVLAGNSQLIANSTGLWANQSAFNHDALLNYAADEHVAHSAVSISPGVGLSGGGTIATTRTLSALANSGIVANATGLYVNTTYIATLDANNATYLNGTASSAYAKLAQNEIFSNGLRIQGQGLGVGPAISPGAAGTITASGDITAFSSDERLKTNIQIIQNALNKIKQVRGITYNHNDLAISFGFQNNERMAGVLAQDFEKVLPEVVTLAPFDRSEPDKNGNVTSKTGLDYKTVKYDKIVSLLIEAIKELNDKVDELTNKVESLTNK